MTNQEIPGQKQAVRKSLFQGHENLTVFSIFVGFVVVIVLLQLQMGGWNRFPTFISPVNLLNILQQVGVPGIIAIGMTIVMISGGIDLSVGMLASLVSIVTALGISKWHLGIVSSILIGVLTAVVLETVMGYIISRTKVEPFIITLGGMIAFQGIALLLCNSREVIMTGELDFFKVNLIQGAKDPDHSALCSDFLRDRATGRITSELHEVRSKDLCGWDQSRCCLPGGYQRQEHEALGVRHYGLFGRYWRSHAAFPR
jgi:hypothetical protein